MGAAAQRLDAWMCAKAARIRAYTLAFDVLTMPVSETGIVRIPLSWSQGLVASVLVAFGRVRSWLRRALAGVRSRAR